MLAALDVLGNEDGGRQGPALAAGRKDSFTLCNSARHRKEVMCSAFCQKQLFFTTFFASTRQVISTAILRALCNADELYQSGTSIHVGHNPRLFPLAVSPKPCGFPPAGALIRLLLPGKDAVGYPPLVLHPKHWDTLPAPAQLHIPAQNSMVSFALLIRILSLCLIHIYITLYLSSVLHSKDL